MILENNKNLEKFECGDCGCCFWVEDRNNFYCPNCFENIVRGDGVGE